MTEGAASTDAAGGTTSTGAGDPVAVARLRQRLQRLVGVALVALLPWFVSPGRIQPDTKLDLVVSPGRYLSRAVWAWNDHTGIGELQNQAYGYLWPMGPFFWAGDLLGAPAWVVQRGWWMLLLVVAMAGAERLARRAAGLPTVPALAVGAVYALSPRVLTVLAEISVEVWPYAVAPWLVLVADRMVGAGATRGRRRRGAVATGLLAACLGGVNATVSLLALVPAAGWLLLAPRGRRRGPALAWWCVGAALGSAWWLGPLLVLGRWSYPFLDHIELASTTTAVASLANVLRGAEHWVAYILTGSDHPTWQGGWVLAQTAGGIIGTCALAALGLAGLLRGRREADGATTHDDPVVRNRHLTRWALASVVLGVLVMAVGRDGSASGPLAGPVQSLLDGPLAPLRNVHKADLLVRLPVALGVGLLLHHLTRVRSGVGDRARAIGVTAVVLALVGATLPVWQGRVGDAWAYDTIPREWHEVAREVDAAAQRDGGATLVLPGARTADYTWGRTAEEPLVALAESPVLARAAAPLGHPAATRVLDGVDLLVSGGQASSALADQVGRLGVRRVVVRWGIAPGVGTVDPDAVARTLDASPGLRRVSEHGEGEGRIVTWEVERPVAAAVAYPTATATTAAAAPEAWTALVESGLASPTAATVLLGDVVGAGADEVVATDTLRWQALNSGRPPQRGRSPTLPADDPRPAEVGTKDLAPGGAVAGRTTRDTGAVTVTTSSSAADPFASTWVSARVGPYAMIDGDPTTAWRSGDGEPEQRLRLDLPTAERVGTVVVRPAGGTGLSDIARVQVAGTRAEESGDAFEATLDGSARREVGVDITASPGATDPMVGVAEVELRDPDGRRVATSTRLVVPEGGAGLLLTRDPRGAADVREGEDPDDLVRRATPPRGPLDVRAWVRPRPSDAVAARLDAPWSTVGSTPGGEADLTRRPGAALDGDPATRWEPDPAVERPVLDIDLGRRQPVDQVTLSDPVGAVTVTTDHGTWVVPSGTTIDVPGGQTRRLRLTFTQAGRAAWVAPEVALEGPEPRHLGERVDLACGDAGEVVVGDTEVALSAEVAREDLLAGRVVGARPCGDLSWDGATTEVSVQATAEVWPERLALVPAAATDGSDAAEPRPVTARREHAGRWQVRAGPGEESYLTLAQGANEGWRAETTTGDPLEPVTVDGWRQGFVLPAGGPTEVAVVFAPNEDHRRALLLGGMGVVVLLLWGTVEIVRGRGRVGAAAGLRTGGAGRARPAHPVLGLGAAAVLGSLVSGLPGLLAAAAGALVPSAWRPAAVACLLGTAGLALAVLGVAERQSTGAWVAQVLGAVTLGVLVAALLRPGGRAPRR